jgi:DNA-directed RNA polymerase subunit RPC12/RpoP
MNKCKKCGSPIPSIRDSGTAFVLKNGKIEKEIRCADCAEKLAYKLLAEAFEPR